MEVATWTNVDPEMSTTRTYERFSKWIGELRHNGYSSR